MAVTYRAATSTAPGNSISFDLTIPPSAEVDDIALICGVFNPNTVADYGSKPAGWTALGVEKYSSSMHTEIYAKRIVAGDPGSIVTVTYGTSYQKSSAVLVVLAGGTLPPEAIASRNATTSSATHTAPALTSVGGAMLVSVHAERGGTTSTSLTPGNGYTRRADTYNPGGGGTSIALATSAAADPGTNAGATWTTDQPKSTATQWSIAIPAAQTVTPPVPGYKLIEYAGGAATELALMEYAGGTATPVTFGENVATGMADTLTFPSIASHRGGADEGPQNTMTCFNLTAPDNPDAYLECDVQLNASGSLIITHDTTINGEPIAGMTDARWDQMTQEWPTWLPNPPAPRSYWSELATTWGKRRLLVPEMKGTNPDVVNALITDLTARGLQRDVVVQSFTFDWVATVAAAGIEALHLTSSPDFPALVAAGIKHIGVERASVTPQLIQTAHTNQIRVWAYTINSTTDRDALISMGADSIFTNKPTTLKLT